MLPMKTLIASATLVLALVVTTTGTTEDIENTDTDNIELPDENDIMDLEPDFEALLSSLQKARDNLYEDDIDDKRMASGWKRGNSAAAGWKRDQPQPRGQSAAAGWKREQHQPRGQSAAAGWKRDQTQPRGQSAAAGWKRDRAPPRGQSAASGWKRGNAAASGWKRGQAAASGWKRGQAAASGWKRDPIAVDTRGDNNWRNSQVKSASGWKRTVY